MIGWNHRLNGHEFKQAPGDGEGQGNPVCCNPWDHKVSNMTKRLKNNSKLLIAFLPRSKCLLILWLQSPSTLILEPKNIKSVTVSIFSASIWHEVMGLDAIILVFFNIEFYASYFTLLFHPHQEALSSSLLSAIRVASSGYLRFFYISPSSLDSSL